MSNHSNWKKVTGQTPVSSSSTRMKHLGYCHFALEMGYPKEYDSWTEPQQRNYESGRAAAANALGRMGRIPLWKPDAKIRDILPPSVYWPETDFQIGRA